MSYQVFARKYRPQTFADVLGQDHVVRTLSNAIAQNRLAQAYLFCGPRGTGKTSTARIFAKALNCPDGPRIDFDPNAPVCQEIAEGRSLDVLEIDGASNNGVEQVRELRETVKYAPANGRYKIYYIDEVHMLSTAAFNALLKTLEEPPPHVKFIFATTEANKILPTIISRCQRFDLRRIPDPVIANHLLHIAQMEGIALDEKAAYAIAKGADGGMRDAQSMLDQLVAFCGERIVEADVLDMFGFTPMEAVSGLARHVLARDTVGALRFVHQMSDAGKDLARLLGDLIQHFRTLLVHQTDPEAAAENLAPEMASEVAAQARSADAMQLLRIVDGFAELDARMRWASNKRLHLELGVIQAVQSLNEVTLSDVIEAIDKAGGTAAEAQQVFQARRSIAAPSAPPQVIVEPKRPAPTPAAVSRRDDDPAPLDDSDRAEQGNELRTAAAKPSVEAPRVEPVASTTTISSSPVNQNVEIRGGVPDTSGESPSLPMALTSLPTTTHGSSATTVFSAGEDALFDIPESRKPVTDVWLAIQPEVDRKRPLIAHWLKMGTQTGFKGNVVKVGFPEAEVHSCDSLKRDATKRFLEDLASEIVGSPVKFEFVVDPSLQVPVQAPEFFSAPSPPPAAKPAQPPVEAAKPAVQEAPAAPAQEAPAATNEADFYDDPLIKAALEKLKARVIK